MHKREITYIVKTDSSSKTQLVVRTKCSFSAILEKLMSKLKKKRFMKPNAKARFETLNINYYIEYIGECMTLNRKILCFFRFF